MATINQYEYQRVDTKYMTKEYFINNIDKVLLNKVLIPFRKVGVIVPIVEDKRMAIEHVNDIQRNLPNTDFKYARVIGGGSAASTIAISDAGRLVDSGICEAVLVSSWFNNGVDQAGFFWCVITRNKRGFARITASNDEFELGGDLKYGTEEGYRKLLAPFRFMNIGYIVGHMNGGSNDEEETKVYKRYFSDKEFKLMSKKESDGEVGHIDSAIELFETLDECMSSTKDAGGILSVNYGYGGFYNAMYLRMSGMK